MARKDVAAGGNVNSQRQGAAEKAVDEALKNISIPANSIGFPSAAPEVPANDQSTVRNETQNSSKAFQASEPIQTAQVQQTRQAQPAQEASTIKHHSPQTQKKEAEQSSVKLGQDSRTPNPIPIDDSIPQDIDQNINGYDYSYPSAASSDRSIPFKPRTSFDKKSEPVSSYSPVITALSETEKIEEDLNATNSVDIDRGQNVIDDDPIDYNDERESFTSLSSRRFPEAQRRIKKREIAVVASKDWTGNGFTEKAGASRDVRPDAVQIGTDIILEIIREPGNSLLSLVKEITGVEFTIEQLQEDRGMQAFKDIVNNNDIYVVATKSPVPTPESAQGRLLRIGNNKRGVLVHPTQTKIYNLDFDGDGVTIQFTNNTKIFKNCMDYLIGIDGTAMVDEDFFPLIPVTNDRSEFVRFVRDAMWMKLPDGIYKDELANALFDVSHPELFNKSSNELWVELIKEMNKVASMMGNRHKTLSNLLQDLYDDELLINQIEAEAIAESTVGSFEDITQEPGDHFIQMVITDMAIGQLPPNYHDFIVGMSKYVGDIEGKNVQFRLGADTAKRIKWHNYLKIGYGDMRSLYEHTLEAGMALFMNNRSFLGEKIRYAKRMIQQTVIKDVGFPDRYMNADGTYDLESWLKVFGRSYMRIKRLVDVASIKFTCDMDIEHKSVSDVPEIGSDLSSFVQPILSVYGDYTIERMFGIELKFPRSLGEGAHLKGNSMIRKYRRQRLSDFAKNNMLDPYRDSKDKASDASGKNHRYQDATVKRLLLAIADKKTSLESKFNKSLNDMLDSHVKALRKIRTAIDRKYSDWTAYAEEIMSMLHLSGPDMFAYYNMESPDKFILSRYGSKMYEAAKKNDANLLGGIRATMVFQYRMRNIVNINAEIAEQANQDNMHPSIIFESSLQNRLQSEFDVLASSSMLWNTMVKEMKGDKRAFTALRDSKGNLPDWNIDAKEFWKKSTEHTCLVDVMSDSSIPLSMKNAIAADVVRISQQFNHVRSYGMPYQLEIGPRSSYTSLSTMAYQEQPTILSDIESSTNRIRKAFEQSYDDVIESVKKIRKIHGDEAIEYKIKQIANDPQSYCYIDPYIVVDAIDAQLDKSSRASEKAHQERQVGSFYSGMELQRGGYTNAAYRSDNRVLGMVGEDQLTRFDILNALADPDFMLIVYNENGRWVLSREQLCGNNSLEALGEYIEKHPRVALMLRDHFISPSLKNGNGVSFETAMSDLETSFDDVKTQKEVMDGKIFSELINHPMFLGMCSLYHPMHGVSSRSNRQTRRYVVEQMMNIIAYLAKKSISGSSIDPVSILDKLGTTVDTLQTIGGMDEESANIAYTDLRESLARYIADVGKIVREGNYGKYIDSRAYDNIGNLSFDKTSASLFIDVRQTMTGAKTEMSTAIEGGMTQVNTGIDLFFMSQQDRFVSVDPYTEIDEIDKLIGCMTNAGETLSIDNLDQLYDNLGNTPLIVEGPEGYIAPDPTLDSAGNPICAAARFMTIKRSKAAEDLNLKAKKSGDDGTDSVVKTFRYDGNANQNILDVETAYSTGGLFAAKMKLADILMSNDYAEGYKDLDLADYANIASVMIKEITEEGIGSSIVIRSMEEISYAIRNKMPEDTDDVIAEARRIADEVGVIGNNETLQPYSDYQRSGLNSIVSKIRPAAIGTFTPIRRAVSSSFDRAFSMMWRVAGREKSLSIPGLGKKIDKASRDILPRLERKRIAKKVLKDSIYRFDFDRKKTSYEFLGLIRKDDEIKRISPGPASVWIIEPSATNEQVMKAVECCYAYGMTLAFEDVSMLAEYDAVFDEDVIPAPFKATRDNIDVDLVMLPFFDMRMNGNSQSAPMSPSSFQYDPSALVYEVESSRNIYGLGDSEALGSKQFFDRTEGKAGDIEEIDLDDLFFNTLENYIDDLNYEMTDEQGNSAPIQLATKEEIQRKIVDWLDDGPIIDVGIPQSNQNYERVMEKLATQVEEYRRAFSSSDKFGVLPECKPDRIIGWAKCYVKGYSEPVFAPIIPWPTGTNLKAPQKFSIDGIEIDYDTNKINMSWTLTEDMDGHYVKMHEGMGAANKMMMFIDKSVDLGTFKHGRAVDVIVASETTASRRLGTSKRMATLKTLAITASMPPFGFNYGEHLDSFPDNRDIAERLKNERIPIESSPDGSVIGWVDLIGSIGRFSSDPEIDAMLRDQVKLALKTGTVNPSDILASRFKDAYSFMYVDYDFMFQESHGFQNALMKFYNSMMPTLCPDSIDGDYERCLFKPCLDAGYDYGCMQMEVPYPSAKGSAFYMWENVYASFSFFNDDYSAMHKVGLNGSHKTMEQLNALAGAGQKLSGADLRSFANNATSPSSRAYQPEDIELDYGRFIRKDR